MIITEFLFHELDGHLCMWCPSDAHGADLAAMAERAATGNMPAMSCVPDVVETLWPWLEKTPVKILSRFYVEKFSPDTTAVSDLAMRINSSFRHGAVGAQIFVRPCDAAALATTLAPVRDDLFFNRDLTIGMDICAVDSCDWGALFDVLNNIKASSLALAMSFDGGAKSDFVGRVYGMLNSCDMWRGGVDFMLGDNMVRIDQAWRLVSQMRPQLAANTRFFIN